MNQEQLFQITTIESHLVVIMVAQKKGLLTSCVKAMKDLKHRHMSNNKTRTCKDVEDSYDYGPETLNRLLNAELRAMLKSRGLKRSGPKSTLIDRLVTANIAYMEKRVIKQLMADDSDDEDAVHSSRAMVSVPAVVIPPVSVPTVVTPVVPVAPINENTNFRVFMLHGEVYRVNDFTKDVYDYVTHDHIGTINIETKTIMYNREYLIKPPGMNKEIIVSRFCDQNRVYLLDKVTGFLYNFDTCHRVGHYNDKTRVVGFVNSFL